METRYTEQETAPDAEVLVTVCLALTLASPSRDLPRLFAPFYRWYAEQDKTGAARLLEYSPDASYPSYCMCGRKVFTAGSRLVSHCAGCKGKLLDQRIMYYLLFNISHSFHIHISHLERIICKLWSSEKWIHG